MMGNLQSCRRMIFGVCAWIAMRTGLPTWAVRVFAVLLLCTHGPLTLIAYCGAAFWLKSQNGAVNVNLRWRQGPGAAPFQPRPWPGPAPSGSRPDVAAAWQHDALMDRFNRLDRRLSKMEAEAADGEFALRRSFRDLERG